MTAAEANARRRARAWIAVSAAAVVALGMTWFSSFNRAREIRFDLGHDLVTTARDSGFDGYAVRNVDGFVSYSVNRIPATVQATYSRPGFEISWQPLFAFTMYADRHRNGVVETASLQLDKAFASDAQAQRFVEQTIAQFRKGRWQRYADPAWDTLLTGRSSLLDAGGEIEAEAMTIDPDYTIAPQDWVRLVDGGATWRWVGDGVLARLSVNADRGIGGAPPTYRIDLDFDLLEVKLQQDQDNAIAQRRKYDAMGKHATADYEKSRTDRLAQLKRLEANAIQRGDRLLVAH